MEAIKESLAWASDLSVFNFSLVDLLQSFAILILVLILRGIVTRFVFARMKSLAAQTTNEYDDRVLDGIEPPISHFLLLTGFYLAIIVLPISNELRQFFSVVFRGVSTLLVFWGLLRFVDILADILVEISRHKGHSIAAFIPLLRKATRVFVIVIGVIMVVDNLGYSVGGILATLGLGGAALAFASKDTIANLYGSFALALDRPFQVGDWIQVGSEVDGDVEEVGLRSTKVRSWPKTIVSIPNSVLANEIIDNWSRMPKRRVKQIVGVTYETKPDDMEGIVEDIRQLLRDDDGVDHDFLLVNFTDFGESSLDVLVYYFTRSIAWLEHMDVRQRINIKIMRAVEARGLSIAFPTRSVYLEGANAERIANVNLPGVRGPDLPR